jgi:L-ascorbate metabolism protein UlaG (beta-lactamase superfamily)
MKIHLKLFLLKIFLSAIMLAQAPKINVKYMGHASFLLRFDNSKTLLMDYGKSNVYKEYGYESPISKLSLTPDIATYSHKHPDHYGGVFPDSGTTKLIGPESIALDWITIKALPAFEKSDADPDNFSYLITYKGIKTLHLGDVQNLIIYHRIPGVIEKIKNIYDDKYDIVFLPIGFTKDIVEDAVEFLRFLNTKIVIPMHYWKKEEKERFIQLALDKNSNRSVNYKLEKVVSLNYSEKSYTENEIVILDIEREKEINN